MKRLGIFVLRDRLHKIDNNTLILLKEMSENVNDLLLFTDSLLTKEEKDKAAIYADKIICEPCSSSYCCSYAKAIIYLESCGELNKYQYVLFMNDDVFGPFYPIKEILSSLKAANYDVGGLYCQLPWEISGNGYKKPYIPSYFWLVGNKVWQNETVMRLLRKLAGKGNKLHLKDRTYEQAFFQLCEKENLQSGTFYDLSDWLSSQIDKNFGILEYKLKDLLIQKNYPFLPRERFRLTLINDNSLWEILEYIRTATNYDQEFIWTNILQNCNIADIKNNFNLNYILPSDYCTNSLPIKRGSVLLVAHMYYTECVEEGLSYLYGVPDEIDIIITYNNDRVCQRLKEQTDGWAGRRVLYRKVRNRGRDAAALFTACGDVINRYEYLCFIHDKKTSGNVGPSVFGDWFRFDTWDNCVKNKNYICNILALFQSESQLGFLSPPYPKFFEYANMIGNEWTECFDVTRKLAQDLGLKVDLDSEKPPFVFSNTFWCRTCILKPLLNYGFRYEDFPEEPLPVDGTLNHGIERIYAYCAQAMGYYSGVVQSQEYASMELTNMLRLIGNNNYTIGGLKWEIELNKMGLEEQGRQLVRQAQQLIEQAQMFEEQRLHQEQQAQYLEERNQLIGEQTQQLERQSQQLERQAQYIEELTGSNLELGQRNSYLENRCRELAEKNEAIYGSRTAIRENCSRNLYSFCKRYKNIYIYGAGKKAGRIANQITDYGFGLKAFIISDNLEKPEYYLNHTINYLSDVKFNGEDGLIVALNAENTQNAMPFIQKCVDSRNIFWAD